MTIQEIAGLLEVLAPPALQESYDNCGLLLGIPTTECLGILCCLDVTEAVVDEAVANRCNLIVAHHPLIFGGLKKITGSSYVERTVIKAIENKIAVYAIHTNLDNVMHGVNEKIAKQLQLQQLQILSPKSNLLVKLSTYVPVAFEEKVKEALFKAGAGTIGQYDECSFTVTGNGTFKASEKSSPFVGNINQRHTEPEAKLEVILPNYLQQTVVKALLQAHPYEEVAYDLINLNNRHAQIGSGMIGTLANPMSEQDFFTLLKSAFGLKAIRHTPFLNKPIEKVAVCGGSGSFLTKQAIKAGAQIYVTADVKYHEYFDADSKIVLADIGHWESEQFTADIIIDFLRTKIHTFAVLKSQVTTNPLRYFI